MPTDNATGPERADPAARRTSGRGTITARLTRWMQSRAMLYATFVVSMLESTVLPIPLEFMLIPAMQLRRDRRWWLALSALLGCMVGAVGGYALGYAIIDPLRAWVVEPLGLSGTFEQARSGLNNDGFWFVLSVGLTPVPFQIAMLAAGAADYPMGLFLLAAALARGVRYFGLALLVGWLGDRAQGWVRRHRWWAVSLMTAAIVLFWLGKWWLGK